MIMGNIFQDISFFNKFITMNFAKLIKFKDKYSYSLMDVSFSSFYYFNIN